MTVEREQLNVVFDQVGTPTYAADLAALIVHVLETGKYRQHQGIYHFSNEGVCSWYDFAKEIVAITGANCKVNPVTTEEYPSKVKRPAYSILDKTKIKETFNLEIRDWREALKSCMATF